MQIMLMNINDIKIKRKRGGLIRVNDYHIVRNKHPSELKKGAFITSKF